MAQVDVQCSTVWNKVKGETVRQNIGRVGAFAAKLAKAANKNYTFEIDGTDLVFNLDRDIHTICPGTKTSKILKKIGKDFHTITCNGLNTYVGKKGLSRAIQDKIKQMCPSIIESCTPTICDGRKASLTLKCQDINNIFHLLLQDPKILALIHKELPSGIDISKIAPCSIAQVLSSLGIKAPEIFASILDRELSELGVRMPESAYRTIVNCACPKLDMNKELECSSVTNIIDAVLGEPSVQKIIKDEAGVEITDRNKCDILQQMVDAGIEPEKLLYEAIKEQLGEAYTPEREKLHEAIKCLCPGLKPKKHDDDDGGEDAPPGKNNVPVIYNKITIFFLGVLVLGIALLLQLIMHLTGFHLRPEFLNFLFVFVILTLVGYILVKKNPRCLFKACINAGKDWESITGKFKGNKSILGITVNAELEVLNDNTARLIRLGCKGRNCPFSNLLDKCKDPIIRINKEKTVYGYALKGECIDTIHNYASTVQGLWVIQGKNDISLNVKVNVPVTGIIFLNIPLKRV